MSEQCYAIIRGPQSRCVWDADHSGPHEFMPTVSPADIADLTARLAAAEGRAEQAEESRRYWQTEAERVSELAKWTQPERDKLIRLQAWLLTTFEGHEMGPLARERISKAIGFIERQLYPKTAPEHWGEWLAATPATPHGDGAREAVQMAYDYFFTDIGTWFDKYGNMDPEGTVKQALSAALRTHPHGDGAGEGEG